MAEWQVDAGLRWRALQPFGVEIDQDLAAPLTAAQSARFVELLWANGLLLARGQHLGMERQRELCALAGPILLRAGESGYLSNAGGAEPSLSELRWHADAAYTEAPFDCLSLHAIDVVDEASSTCFMNAADACDALPAALRRRLAALQVEMIAPGYESLALRTCDKRDPVAQKRGVRPAIVRNPHNGRDCVWVSEMQSARVLGISWEDSRALLHEIYTHLYRPTAVFEHRWRSGDFILWDNIALQHMRGSLRSVGRRVLQRVIVGTDGVAPHVALDA